MPYLLYGFPSALLLRLCEELTLPLPHSSYEHCCLRTSISVFSRLASALMAMFVLLSCALTWGHGEYTTRRVGYKIGLGSTATMQYVVFWKFLSLRQTNIREEVEGQASKCQTDLTPEETRGTTLNPFTIVFVRAAGKVDRGAGAALGDGFPTLSLRGQPRGPPLQHRVHSEYICSRSTPSADAVAPHGDRMGRAIGCGTRR